MNYQTAFFSTEWCSWMNIFFYFKVINKKLHILLQISFEVIKFIFWYCFLTFVSFSFLGSLLWCFFVVCFLSMWNWKIYSSIQFNWQIGLGFRSTYGLTCSFALNQFGYILQWTSVWKMHNTILVWKLILMSILFNCHTFKYLNITIHHECGFIDKKTHDHFLKPNKGIFFNR